MALQQGYMKLTIMLSVLLLWIVCSLVTSSAVPSRDREKRSEQTGPGPIEILFDQIGGRKQVDLIIAMDRSKSMSNEVFYLRMKKMVYYMLRQYATLHPEYVRLAVISFAVDATIVIDGISNPDIAPTKCSLFLGDENRWDDVIYTRNASVIAGTNIQEAFRLASGIMETGFNRRPDAERIVLLLSDGKYTDANDPINEARELKENRGASIFGVGIGSWKEIGNVRVLTSEMLLKFLYGDYDDWERLVRETGPLTSFNETQPIEWRQISAALCDNQCGQNAACYCDVDRGYEQCLCHSGNFFSNETGQCEACPVNTYKANIGNEEECIPCPLGTEATGTQSTNIEKCACTTGDCTNPCDSNPCNDHQDCIPDNNTDYHCVCKDGWTGIDCAGNPNSCENNMCHTGSQCLDGLGTGVYTCVCTTWGYTGRYCEINENECEEDSCINNGTCTDKINDFQCECTPEWKGRYCQDPMDATTTTTTTPAPAPIPSTTPLATRATTTEAEKSEKGDDTLWIIIGASAGGGVLIIIIIIVVACFICNKRKQKNKEEVKSIARQFSGFWKKKTVRGNKWADEEVNGGLPSAPAEHRPDLLNDTNNHYSSVENLKTDEYAELPLNTVTLKTGMESWQSYINELEESKVIERGLIVKMTGEKHARTPAWMYDEDELQRLNRVMEEREVHVPLRIQDGEYHVIENDGTLASGKTIGSNQDPRIVVIGKTRTYMIVVISTAAHDSGKALKEVQWIVDHISGEGY